MSTKGGIQVNRKINLKKLTLKMLSLYLLKQLLFWYWMRIFTDQVVLLCVMLIGQGRLICLSQCLTLKLLFFLIFFLTVKFHLVLVKHLTPRCLDHSFPIILGDRKFLSEIWGFTGWPYALSLWYELYKWFSSYWLYSSWCQWHTVYS